MIVQSAPLSLQQRNQPNRECLYAWYPEIVTDDTIVTDPRDIYIHNGIDKDLLQQRSPTNGSTSDCSSNVELLQRYTQSVAPSERIYHSTETLDEALRTPWALHYELQRRAATPNLPSNTNDMPARDEPPRRLKSAPLVRSMPPTAMLTIPEPRFVTALIPVVPSPPSVVRPMSTGKPLTRISSAKARLNATVAGGESLDNDSRQRREIRSAQGSRRRDASKLSDAEIEKILTRVYGTTTEHPLPQQQSELCQIIHVQPEPSPVPPPPVYTYQKSASWCPGEPTATPTVKKPLIHTVEVSAVPLNPHYIHRPGVIAVKNVEKKPLVLSSGTSSSGKRMDKHRRHHHHHHHHQSRHHSKRNEPLLALKPISQSTRLSLELDGVKLAYDPTLKLDDPSSQLTKYFVDGRLYLIKDQRYNVLDNIDPAMLEKYNQTLTLHRRPKYYQTIPVEKFHVPKPPVDLHYNASDTYFYNTLPKRPQRYVIDPNFISEHLNVNKMSLSKRPPSANVNDFSRQPSASVYA